MKDKLISLETAKLAKEAGLDIKVENFYNNRGQLGYGNSRRCDFGRTKLSDNSVSENHAVFGYRGGFFNSREEEETITVSKSELHEVFNAMRVEAYYSSHAEARVESLFRGVKKLQCKLPAIELRGANKEINYIARDSSCKSVYGYTSKPEANSAEWIDGSDCMYLGGLDQSQFEAIKAMDWKESLHKVKHI